MDDLTKISAASIARIIRDKKVSSKEVVEAHLRRIEEVNPTLNAVVQLAGERALKEAEEADRLLARGNVKGPLHGVPVTIKDAFDTEGIISTGGTKGRAAYVPKEDATPVARLRRAGAIVLGKTNLPELSIAWESDNLIYGRTNNPYDLSRTPGGSSGGEAAIIAAGGSPLGIGSDSGGSIRQPSHYCGIAGIKPTSGRVSRIGHFPPLGGVHDFKNQIGPMARYVEDLILALPVIAGPDGKDPGLAPVVIGDPTAVRVGDLKIAFYTNNGVAAPTAETISAVQKAARLLSEADVSVEEVRPRQLPHGYETTKRLWYLDGGLPERELLREAGTTETHPLTQQWLQMKAHGPLSSSEIVELIAEWDAFKVDMLTFMKGYDAILCPACAEPALPHGTTNDVDKAPGFSYLTVYNLTGYPGVVVRGGTSKEDLPIGIQVVAGPWREDIVLAVAQFLETALGGFQPPRL